MGDTYVMDGAGIVRDIRELVGKLTDDEAALVRTLTPGDLLESAHTEHVLDLVDLLKTIRSDEAMADYVYAIAPGWDGTIETLLLGGRVTTAFTQFELETCGAAAAATGPRAPAQRSRPHCMPVTVG